jgi:hypothetical protein
MSDKRGLPLPPDFLQNVPDIPVSLEYLKWNIGENGTLYRFERSDDGRVSAVDCNALRKVADQESWVEERVLDY